MKFRMSFINRSLFMAAILLVFIIGSLQAQVIVLSPVEDVFIYTFGGGQGGNPFIKYDISTVPPDMIIDSVYLTPFVWSIGTDWDEDVNYWNVNDQNWTEGDSARLIWDLPTSDSAHQSSGFGTALGWTKSVDLINIFLTDYNVGNTYCSIKMKDPDDMTSVPPPGSYPINDGDSIVIGNILFDEHTIFWPREQVNGPPWLNIYYHEVGVSEEQGRISMPCLQVYPNPFKFKTDITFGKVHPDRRTHSSYGTRSVPSQGDENPRLSDGTESIDLKIYNATGRLIKVFSRSTLYAQCPTHISWDGRDASGKQSPPGVYFCRLEAGGKTIIEKICLIK